MSDAKSRFAQLARRVCGNLSAKDGHGTELASTRVFPGIGALSIRRAGGAGALGLIVAALLLAFASAPASAELAHTTVIGEYGKEGPKAGGLAGGCDISFQTAEQKLYIMGGGKIYGIHRTAVNTAAPVGGGYPVSVSGGECGDPDMSVSNLNGNVYQTPSSPFSIRAFDNTGSVVGGFPVTAPGETCGVSANGTGEVWGGNYSNRRVDKYSASGQIGASIAIGYNICKLVVNPATEDVFVSDYGSEVQKFAASTGYSAGFTIPAPESNPGLALNPTRSVIYVAAGGSTVSGYDTNTGALKETIEFGGGNAGGVAVDTANDTLYIADTTNEVVKEIPLANVPKVTTGEPTGNSSVAGSVDPDGAGNVTECYFQFALANSSTWTNQTNCNEATPYAGVTAVSATLPGLAGETTYKYRLVAANANPGGVQYGAVKNITPHNVKGLITEAATAITRTSAQLNASFEGNGEETKYKFQWGTTTGYGSESTLTSAGSPTYPPKTFVNFSPTNLQPDTTYHYRVYAENGLGVSPGGDKTFKTLPAVQSLTTEAATNIAAVSAILHASFVGDGTPTSYYFKYGKTTNYEFKTNEVSAGSPTGSYPIAEEVTGLELEKLYHFKIVAKNSLGTTEGSDLTFTTLPAVKGLLTKPATDIGQESITLNAEYNGDGRQTNYYFEYGLTTKYGKFAPALPGADAGSPTGPTPLSTVITDYEDYSTYHFRVIAVNIEGTTKGADLTFETPKAPLPEILETNVSGVSPTAATFSASINPNRWPTVYRFEYGPTTDYGESTEISGSIGKDLAAHSVSQAVNNLIPGTLYHVRAAAINFTGTQYGPDVVFFTPDAPRIDLSSARGVTETGASLQASVNPNAGDTSVHFQYGTTGAYGLSTPNSGIGSDTSSHEVGAGLSGLTAGTTYHFRAVATNEHGTTMGPDQTFTTAPGTVQPVQEPPRKRCRKGFVRRHGKCVKRHKHTRRHSTRSHG